MSVQRSRKLCLVLILFVFATSSMALAQDQPHRRTSSTQPQPPARNGFLCNRPSNLRNWDLKELLERLEGDQEFLREILATFREDCRACLHKAHRAMAESDLPDLSRPAHTIEGTLRNLSMKSAEQTASALEKSTQDAAERESGELLLILEAAGPKSFPRWKANYNSRG